MICLHCGECCIQYHLCIIDNPNLPINELFTENNIKYKPTGEKCQHLKGDKPGNYTCAIHHFPWYKKTPCFLHSQYERTNSNCRLGEYFLSKHK